MRFLLIAFGWVVLVLLYLCYKARYSCGSSCAAESSQQELIFSSLEDFRINSYQDLLFLLPNTVAELNLLANAAKTKLEVGLNRFYESASFGLKFENFYLLDDIVAGFSSDSSRISILYYITSNKELADLARKTSTELAAFFNDKYFSKRLFFLLDDYLSSQDFLELEPSQKYCLEKMYKDLKNFGCGLEDEKFVEFKSIQARIDEKCTAFSSNIYASSKKVAVKPEELEGVSERFLSGSSLNEEGFILIGKDYPSVLEVLKYCKNSKTREKVWLNFNNVGYPENDALLSQIVELRNKQAEILGYSSFAEYYLIDKMAENTSNVENFLDKLLSNLKEPVEKEFLRRLKVKPDDLELNNDNRLSPWDVTYLNGIFEKNELSLDDNLVAEYFSLEPTLGKLFELYENLLDVKFEKINKPLGYWHEDVFLIKVFDTKSNDLLGYLYVDLFPREGKYNHACLYPVLTGFARKEERKIPVSVVIANFSKPDEQGVSLLKHNEVETFFHEFGHAMHSILGSRVSMATFSGTNVLWDFVEAPSQMFQEWVWNPVILKQISAHYKTGDALPEVMIQAMIKKRKEGLASTTARQIRFALFSLECYSNKEKQINFSELEAKLSELVMTKIAYDPRSHMYASFGHLTGYAAGYYCYLWSLVFALDMWSLVVKEGLDSDATKKLVKKLLCGGGILHPNDLLKSILGREPSTEAFEAHLLYKDE